MEKYKLKRENKTSTIKYAIKEALRKESKIHI